MFRSAVDFFQVSWVKLILPSKTLDLRWVGAENTYFQFLRLNCSVENGITFEFSPNKTCLQGCLCMMGLVRYSAALNISLTRTAWSCKSYGLIHFCIHIFSQRREMYRIDPLSLYIVVENTPLNWRAYVRLTVPLQMIKPPTKLSITGHG